MRFIMIRDDTGDPVLINVDNIASMRDMVREWGDKVVIMTSNSTHTVHGRVKDVVQQIKDAVDI